MCPSRGCLCLMIERCTNIFQVWTLQKFLSSFSLVITLWRVILIFKLLYIARYFQKFWLIDFVNYNRLKTIKRIWLLFQGCLIHKLFPIWLWLLNSLKYLPVLLSSRLLLRLALLAFTFPAASYFLALVVSQWLVSVFSNEVF